MPAVIISVLVSGLGIVLLLDVTFVSLMIIDPNFYERFIVMRRLFNGAHFSRQAKPHQKHTLDQCLEVIVSRKVDL